METIFNSVRNMLDEAPAPLVAAASGYVGKARPGRLARARTREAKDKDGYGVPRRRLVGGGGVFESRLAEGEPGVRARPSAVNPRCSIRPRASAV